MRANDSMEKLTRPYLKEIFTRHGVPVSIISVRDGYVESIAIERGDMFRQTGEAEPSTFHVSNLKKCFSDEPLSILLDEIQIDDKLNFIEELVEIMDCEVKRLKKSLIPIVKVC
ncbi:hypothetical protein Tco_0407981 [Tanacetum coccineum]